MLSSEVTPFAKTGGLADVTAALTAELVRGGHDVRLFMPFYRRVQEAGFEVERVPELTDLELEAAGETYAFTVFTTPLPRSEAKVHLLHCDELYGRDGLYSGDDDEHVRFGLFTRAVIECCQRLGFAPHVFHANDWHTALLPLYLKSLYAWDELFRESKSVLTIHNIGYQGLFPAATIEDLGLGDVRERLYQEDLRDGVLNFMKTGLLYADLLTTVSETYAREIQTEDFGMGLHELLRARAESLRGIVNGVDYDEWSPEKDAKIPYHFSADDLAGKARNKRALLDTLRLPHDHGAPVLGIVSRMAAQKGFDLMFQVLPRVLAERDVRLCVLGSGEERYERFFQWLASEFPTKVGYDTAFNDKLAHLIEAGSDLFLMPSRYEPCGLNQMYSLRYGTIPIVRRTGGLADTVQQFDPETGAGTGFVFDHYTPDGLRWALDVALRTYADRESWAGLVQNAMAQDYSWKRQAERYVDLYRELAPTP